MRATRKKTAAAPQKSPPQSKTIALDVSERRTPELVVAFVGAAGSGVSAVRRSTNRPANDSLASRKTMSSQAPRPRQLAFLMAIKQKERQGSVVQRDAKAARAEKPPNDENWRKLLLDRLERTGLAKLHK